MPHPANIELDVHANTQLADVNEDGGIHFLRKRYMVTSMPPIVTQIITGYLGSPNPRNICRNQGTKDKTPALGTTGKSKRTAVLRNNADNLKRYRYMCRPSPEALQQ